jgi:hypothetical protein
MFTKIVCISNIELGFDTKGKPTCKTLPITIGKTYEVISEFDRNVSRKRKEKFYLLKSDDDAKDSIFLIYPTSHFVPLDVWREMRINKII